MKRLKEARCPIRGENAKLREQVERLNRRFFEGRLKIDTVGYFSKIDPAIIAQAQFNGIYVPGKGGEGIMNVGVNPIFMNLKFDLTDTLVHELIHIWQYQTGRLDREREGHGKYFFAAGRMIMSKDPNIEITTYATKKETKMLHAVAELMKKRAISQVYGEDTAKEV